MKKAKVITGVETTEFENKLDAWFLENKQTEIINIDHSISNGVFSALIIFKEVYKTTGGIKARLPHIEDIPPNELKGML